MPSFKERSPEKEIMDLEVLDPATAARTYVLIRRVNRYLGGTRVVTKHLERFSEKIPASKTIRILDVASGAADIPQAVAEMFRKKGRRAEITALDLHYEAMRSARGRMTDYPEITWLQGDCFNLPFAEGSFDYVISSMFFHHLSNEQIVRAFKIFDRIATRGIVINDLLRDPGAYWGIYALSRFTGNRPFRNDAPLSVLRGFTRPEAEELIRQTGLSYLKVHNEIFFRLAFVGDKHA